MGGHPDRLQVAHVLHNQNVRAEQNRMHGTATIRNVINIVGIDADQSRATRFGLSWPLVK